MKASKGSPTRNTLQRVREEEDVGSYQTEVLFNESQQRFFALVLFNEDIVLKDDVKVRVRTLKGGLSFYFWLNAKFLLESVGKVKFVSVFGKESRDVKTELEVDDLLLHERYNPVTETRTDNYLLSLKQRDFANKRLQLSLKDYE